MRTSCALQNKNRTFKTLDKPYFIIWSEISFVWNISDHDVGSTPWGRKRERQRCSAVGFQYALVWKDWNTRSKNGPWGKMRWWVAGLEAHRNLGTAYERRRQVYPSPPYPSLVRNRYPLIAGSTESSNRQMSQRGFKPSTYRWSSALKPSRSRRLSDACRFSTNPFPSLLSSSFPSPSTNIYTQKSKCIKNNIQETIKTE